MPKIYLQNTSKRYDDIEIMPSGWVRAWNNAGEIGEKRDMKNYPPNRIKSIDGECKYRVEK